MKKKNTSPKIVSFGAGIWQVSFDEKDRLLQGDWKSGKTEILLNDNCLQSVWKGVKQQMKGSGMDKHFPDHVCEVLTRYERIMWLCRPRLAFEEARLIAHILQGYHLYITPTKVGLKEEVFMLLSDCETASPGFFEKFGVNQPKLLARIESMTPIEIFSLVHSAEAFRCGDHSDDSVNRYFKIKRAKEAIPTEDQTHA